MSLTKAAGPVSHGPGVAAQGERPSCASGAGAVIAVGETRGLKAALAVSAAIEARFTL